MRENEERRHTKSLFSSFATTSQDQSKWVGEVPVSESVKSRMTHRRSTIDDASRVNAPIYTEWFSPRNKERFATIERENARFAHKLMSALPTIKPIEKTEKEFQHL